MGKLCEVELNYSRQREYILLSRINVKDSINSLLYERLSIADQIHETYKQDSIYFTMEINVLNSQIVSLNKQLKKQKRKTFISRVGIVAVAGVGAYLLLKP